MRRPLAIAGLVALIVPALALAGGSRVTYLTGASVYVDAGHSEGLSAGDTVTVLRDGARIALVRVNVASNHRSSCDTLWTNAALAVGDSVIFHESGASPASPAVAAAPAPLTPAPVATAASITRKSETARLRGRVGARWLSVNTPGGGKFQQPALDLRADATSYADGRVDFSLDMRNRRTTRSFAGTGSVSDQFARVYRASLTVHGMGDPRRRLTLGRQISPTLAAISLFDGALLQTGNDHHSFGLFSGTQPDPERYSFSGDIMQTGAFVEFHQPPVSARHWSVSMGGVTSQEKGQPNRDFFFAQSSWFSGGTYASLSQEVDINRGWKRALGAPVLSPTSTFATLRVPVTKWLSADAGFDNRHNVRLYRDRLTPETQFDDTYRQGAWGGAQLALGPHLRLNGEGRQGSGGDPMHSWSSGAEVQRLTPWNVAVRGRASGLTSLSLESKLYSGSLSCEPRQGLRLDFTSGQRTARNPAIGLDDTETWQSLDGDMSLWRRAYMNAGFERDHSASGNTTQLQAGIAWRF
jgi:hypothetical protein